MLNRRGRFRLCLSCLLAASAGSYATEPPLPVLQIDPVLCVLERGQDSCPVPLRISWQAPELSGAICLYQSTQRQPLYCQYQAGNVSVELVDPLRDNARFELRLQSSQQVLAFAEVVLARPLAELRPRRRHGWGMF